MGQAGDGALSVCPARRLVHVEVLGKVFGLRLVLCTFLLWRIKDGLVAHGSGRPKGRYRGNQPLIVLRRLMFPFFWKSIIRRLMSLSGSELLTWDKPTPHHKITGD